MEKKEKEIMVNKTFDIEKRDNYDDQKEITNEIKTDNDIIMIKGIQ